MRCHKLQSGYVKRCLRGVLGTWILEVSAWRERLAGMMNVSSTVSGLD